MLAAEKLVVVEKINLQTSAGKRRHFNDQRIIVVVDDDVDTGQAHHFMQTVAADTVREYYSR
jgi:hypothetical protein